MRQFLFRGKLNQICVENSWRGSLQGRTTLIIAHRLSTVMDAE